MNLIFQVVPLLYLLFIIGLCTFLLIRGITHSFVAVFACGAALEMIPHLGFIVLSALPGGFSANARYYSMLQIFALIGIVCFAVGFFLLAKFLLSAAPRAN